VHSNIYQNEDDVKKNHSKYSAFVSIAQLQHAINNVFLRGDACLWTEGNYFQTMVNTNLILVAKTALKFSQHFFNVW
jgi:hypothetical protein